MSHQDRPRRSALYMPGINTRALEKGRSLDADMLILDLEDSVAPDKKDEARGNIAHALRQGGYGDKELLVRINHLETEWAQADIKEISSGGADGLVMPKTEKTQTIHEALALMDKAGAPDQMKLWFMIETPLGLLNAQEIAASSNRIGGIILGTEDLRTDMRVASLADRTPLLYALSHSITVARAYGLPIIDGPYGDLSDDEGFTKNCQQSRDLGFDGKSLIHPKTIDTANIIFSPTAEEIDHSKRLINAFEKSLQEGKGVTTLDGKLVENLHVANARRILSISTHSKT